MSGVPALGCSPVGYCVGLSLALIKALRFLALLCVCAALVR